MKRISNISNKLAVASSIFGAACLVLTPVGAYAIGRPVAATTTANANSAAATPKPGLCNGLTNQANVTNGRITALNGKVSQAWSQQDQKLAAQFQKVDQKVADARKKADAARDKDFSKLEAKAKTTDQKQAVQTYEAAVHDAVNTRRAAYDAARQAFRTGVQNAIISRRDTITAQLTTFQDSVSSAFSTAEASCSGTSPDGRAIQQTLRANLRSARTTFQNDRKSDGTVGSQVKQLVATRQAAFKAADKVFQDSLAAARQTLQQAFGGDKSI